jgi:hypothetical protein
MPRIIRRIARRTALRGTRILGGVIAAAGIRRRTRRRVLRRT